MSMIEAYLAYTFSSQKELSEAAQMFRLLDTNRDGFIEKEELSRAFESANECFSAEEVGYVLETVDNHHSGS